MSSNAPQTLAWEPLDSEHILACPRSPLLKHIHAFPERYIAGLQNHPKECCRDAGNLDVEAWFSKASERLRTMADQVMGGTPLDQVVGTPDIYKFHCNSCGACHVRFCVGGNHPTDPTKLDLRPFWEVR